MREQGVGVVSYALLAFGLLTGAITAETRFPEGDWRGAEQDEGPFSDVEASLEVVGRLRPVAERLGCGLAEHALAWNVHQPGVTSAIAEQPQPGARPDERVGGRHRVGRRHREGARHPPGVIR